MIPSSAHWSDVWAATMALFSDDLVRGGFIFVVAISLGSWLFTKLRAGTDKGAAAGQQITVVVEHDWD